MARNRRFYPRKTLSARDRSRNHGGAAASWSKYYADRPGTFVVPDFPYIHPTKGWRGVHKLDVV